METRLDGDGGAHARRRPPAHEHDYLAQAIATASLSREPAPWLLGFLELLFNTRDERDGRDQLAVNVGLVYRLTRSLAVDAGVQTSVVGHGPDYVVRSGLSVLWR